MPGGFDRPKRPGEREFGLSTFSPDELMFGVAKTEPEAAPSKFSLGLARLSTGRARVGQFVRAVHGVLLFSAVKISTLRLCPIFRHGACMPLRHGQAVRIFRFAVHIILFAMRVTWSEDVCARRPWA
ncbi:unnamed protein product [Symbiodinium microadriaticum]|nr:unnamed protein product [Symbiodinium microadriaticum]